MNLAPAFAPSAGSLRFDGVSKVYDQAGASVAAVDGCTFEIAAGEICMVVGPSGCGKTTLLNAVAGFHGISAGRILLDGAPLCSGDGESAAPGSDRIVVFQNGALFPWKTVLDNVAFGPIVQGKLAKAEARERARQALADAGVTGVEESYPGEISSGMRRRVEIARALMNEPKVLLLDEPYRALDALTKSVMHEALLEVYYKTKVTIFFITHDLDEAVFLGHRVVVMTTRPCRPKKIVTIDIPHPRASTVTTTPRYRELVQETRAAVHGEVLAAFRSGEKEG